MGFNNKQVGGGPATGLANDFVAMLSHALGGGGFGPAGGRTGSAATMDSSMNMFSVLNNILSPGGGTAGASINEMISKDIDRQANMLRARFNTGGGMAEGTPAAFAEGVMRGEAAPRATQAVTEMQMAALMPILQIMAGISSKGIAQREEVMQPNPFMNFMSAFAPLAGAVAGGPAGAALGGLFGNRGGANVVGGPTGWSGSWTP